MLSMVKMPLNGEVGGSALNSSGNNIVDHGIVFLNFCEKPEIYKYIFFANSRQLLLDIYNGKFHVYCIKPEESKST